MTEAIKTDYDTLSTCLHWISVDRTPDYYLHKWKCRQGLLQRSGGGKIEKFRRISRYQRIQVEDIIEDQLPRVCTSEYHFYRWHVGTSLCVYCNCELTNANRTQDHVIPRARGGSKLGYDNLEPACIDCNSAKGNKSLLAFLVTRSGPTTVER
jgi:hypothetical protein